MGILPSMLELADTTPKRPPGSQGVVGKFASFVADLTENSASNPVRKFFVKRVEKVTDN
jgi:hypothetical protein